MFEKEQSVFEKLYINFVFDNFKKRVEEKGWKQAVKERDDGTFDWTKNEPFSK